MAPAGLQPEFFVGEMLPYFISNRVLSSMKTERLTIAEISVGFNVASIDFWLDRSAEILDLARTSSAGSR
jgi:hypothetical protein